VQTRRGEGRVSIRTRRDGRGARKRSCQSSMYRDESLIAPEALPAKLLSWNVTLPRHPPFPENRVSSTSSNYTITLRILSRRRCTTLRRCALYVIYSAPLRFSSLARHPIRMCVHTGYVYTTPLGFWHFVALENIVAIPDAKSAVRKSVYRFLHLASTSIKTVQALRVPCFRLPTE